MLLGLERAGFAWEWLRRQAEYCEQALKAIDGDSLSACTEDDRARPWHLHRFGIRAFQRPMPGQSGPHPGTPG